MAVLDIPIEQEKRLKSAEDALSFGRWVITQGLGGWKVITPSGSYALMAQANGQFTCSCPDFGLYGSRGLECKHVCGLRLWLSTRQAVQPADQQIIDQGENRMSIENLVRECGWVKLFHPSNAQVTIPLSLDKPILVAEAQALMASVTSLLQAGFSVDMPGLEEGEHEEEMGFVVRRAKVNADETETPVVDLYPVNANFRRLAKYLNDEAGVREFEAACGLSLASLPLYEGDNTIERGKNPKMEKYVVALTRPVKIVWKYNPRYEGENDKKNLKRIFVRWGAGAATSNDHKASSQAETMSIEAAKGMICPLGSKSHPEFKGMSLEKVAQTDDGRKVLDYLAGEQYQPNGDKAGQKVKQAAKMLLAALQPV